MAAAVDRQRHLRRQPDQGYPAHRRHRPYENTAEAEETAWSIKIGGTGMNVLVVEPGFLPYEKEINGLRDMQELVGGSIQAIYPFKETVALVCNEEGILQHLEFNRSIPERGYGGIFGTFFVCGLGEEDFTSLTPEQVKTYTARFKKAEVFIAMNGDKPFTIRVDAAPKHLPDKPKHSQKPPKR